MSKGGAIRHFWQFVFVGLFLGLRFFPPAFAGEPRFSIFVPERYDTAPLRLTSPLPNVRLVILKRERVLRLYSGSSLLKRYPIALGAEPLEDKEIEGDERTPEGVFYFVTREDLDDGEGFYGFMGLSYPNPEDAVRGYLDPNIRLPVEIARRIIRSVRGRATWAAWTRARSGLWYLPKLGGEIGLHGGGLRLREIGGRNVSIDWTEGCIAMEDTHLDEIRQATSAKWEVVPILIAREASELDGGSLSEAFQDFLIRPDGYVSAGSLRAVKIPGPLEDLFAIGK